MEQADVKHDQVSSTTMDDEIVDAMTDSITSTDSDGIGEVWYRPPILDPPPPKVTLRVRTNRPTSRDETLPTSPTSPMLQRPVTALSIGRGEPVVKRKKSIRVIAGEYKKALDEALKAWVGPHPAGEVEPKEGRPFKRLLKRKMTSDSDVSLHTMTCKWVRGEAIGNSGRMFVALSMRTGEMMALKQVELPSGKRKHWTSKQAEDLERLKKETHILSGLEHSNIVQYLGYEETDSVFNLFLGYVSGGSVGALLRNYGKLKEQVIIHFLKQIVDGVNHLHLKGIIHHNLLADNILVEVDGVIKICSLGASEKVARSGSQEFETAYRIAPEVINLHRNGNQFKVDIWSIGCLFLEMMTGSGPWSDMEMLKALSQLSKVQLSTDVRFSELADDFRKDCLAVNPDERASASELLGHGYLELPSGWTFEESS